MATSVATIDSRGEKCPARRGSVGLEATGIMRTRQISNEAVEKNALERMSAKAFRRLQEVAWHEAGHAVAMFFLHIPFRHATIKSDEDSLGHVLSKTPRWFQPDCDNSDRQGLYGEKRIISLFAGRHAQALFLGRKPRWGYEHDYHAVVHLSGYLVSPGETENAFLRYLNFRARDLVNRRTQFIEAVAWALLEFETIDRDEVCEAIMPGSIELRDSLRRAV